MSTLSMNFSLLCHDCLDHVGMIWLAWDPHAVYEWLKLTKDHGHGHGHGIFVDLFTRRAHAEDCEPGRQCRMLLDSHGENYRGNHRKQFPNKQNARDNWPHKSCFRVLSGVSDLQKWSNKVGREQIWFCHYQRLCVLCVLCVVVKVMVTSTHWVPAEVSGRCVGIPQSLLDLAKNAGLHVQNSLYSKVFSIAG